MSGKSRNPLKSCKACGAPVKANVCYCVACAIQRKAARVGIDPRKVHVGVVRPPCTTRAALGLDNGVYFTPKAALDVICKQPADIATMNPPLSTGGYLGELLPKVKHLSAPSGGEPEALNSRRQETGPSPANLEGTR